MDSFEPVRNGENTEPALLLSAVKTAELLGIGRTSLYALHSSGRLPMPVRLNHRVLWCRAELEDWTKAGCPDRERWELIKKQKQ